MLKNQLISAMGGAPANYIEEVFSTWLYTGNGSTQTITNGIDLAGKGGLVWGKSRTSTIWNYLTDTVRGQYSLFSNDASAQQYDPLIITSFNSDGFSTGNQNLNASGTNYASWTFRKQPKFFDVVTWTGNSTAGRQISHSLGSVPGCIIVKRLDAGSDWSFYHRSLGATQGMTFNSTYFAYDAPSFWSNTTPTSTVFTVGTDSTINASGGTYVAYLFAHNAGGFGLTGTDNVISCGSFTTDGSGGATVNHGFADGAQFCMVKASSTTGDWEMYDDKRTTSWSSADARLRPNLSNAEDTQNRLSGSGASLTFANLSASQTYIYILVAAP